MAVAARRETCTSPADVVFGKGEREKLFTCPTEQVDVLVSPVRVWPETPCWHPVIGRFGTGAVSLGALFCPAPGRAWRPGSVGDGEQRCRGVKKGRAVSRGHQLFHCLKKSLTHRVPYQIETA